MSALDRPWARAGLVLAAVLVADQATKALVRDGMRRGDEDPILPFLKLVNVRNEGEHLFGAVTDAALVGELRHPTLAVRRRACRLQPGEILAGVMR